MLPLPIFRHHSPETVDEAVSLLASLGDRAKLIAGGTDLLPNMKHGLFEPEHVVSLVRVRELFGIRVTDDALEIGAMTPLGKVADSADVRAHATALAEACAAVGGPHHRRMGTLGGNVCLDTRCVYYNQTYFWRQSLGFCLKKDGTECHVVQSGKNCVAAASNDSAPALLVLDATIVLAGPQGQRLVAANDFYTPDGIYNTVRQADEIVTAIRIPITVENGHLRRRSSFEKLRRRGAIDFPLLNTAARIDFGEDDTIAGADLVVSTLAARPKRIKAAKRAHGATMSEELCEGLANAAHKSCKPLTNLDNDPLWRREMVRVIVRKALRRLAP